MYQQLLCYSIYYSDLLYNSRMRGRREPPKKRHKINMKWLQGDDWLWRRVSVDIAGYDYIYHLQKN